MFGSNPKTSSAISPSKEIHQSGHGSAPNRISSGVSITGDVKFSSELVIDGEVEGTINSPGKLSIGEHAQINGEIRAKSVKVRGTVEGNIFATERCELQSGCTLRGDIEAPRLVVDENATFLGSAKVTAAKLTNPD